jgi:hypothetical protein
MSEPSQAALAARRPKQRLRTIADLDGRTIAARRARDLVAALTADLGGDLSAAQAELVQRAGLLGAFLEDAEARWLAGDDVDVAAWLSAIDRQRRTLMALGLERRSRPVPTLTEYLESLPASAKPAPKEGP